ncbi:MAG: NAD(P)H-hydrate dehydratase [Alphaproteobacteria bacterium]|nr:NAD(P)H-hydrate dehydratase [Alphaproteobacteria bacterium]
MACDQDLTAYRPSTAPDDSGAVCTADEILSTAEMYAADACAVKSGLSSLALMEAAGTAVAEHVHRNWPAARVAVLCGPGNNGGDGFVAARHLSSYGHDVRLALLGSPEALRADVRHMATLWHGGIAGAELSVLDNVDVVVDALFGAGLSRPLEGVGAQLVRALNQRHVPVIAVDVPSGLSGDLGRPLGEDCVRATLTVTFFRKKPAHVLMPGRLLCGETYVCDIGISQDALRSSTSHLWENSPRQWLRHMPWPDPLGHKYGRGHSVVVSGPAHATGAARLAARAALRVGSGLVSIASPTDAVLVNAAAVTAIMVKPFEGVEGLTQLLRDQRLNAVAIGPGCGVGESTRALVAAVRQSGAASVLDADALTSFTAAPEALYSAVDENAVLTPHEGEFERVFPGLLEKSATRIDAARTAARMAGCTVILKGPDSVIAAPDGRAVVNTNAPPWLATAGSGDVLSGLVVGLLAQGMKPFGAACCAVWLHGQAARRFGLGLIAEDLPEQIPAVLGDLRRRVDEQNGAHDRTVRPVS